MNKISCGTSDDDTWSLACHCADLYICADIARTYGLRALDESFVDLLRRQISDQLFAQALEFRRRTFDGEEFHRRCRQVRSQRERRAAHLAAQRARLPSSHPRAWKRDVAKYVLGHHRYQLPVGQGGFNVGTLRNLGRNEAMWRASLASDAIPSADFLYVYDCGSDPIAGVIQWVRSIVARRPSRRLDMLFVSHFDRDHICGIPHLLHEKRGLRVDTIVMPYLDDIDRIIAFGRSAATRGERSAERFHEDAVVDPVGAMARFGPRQIIMVMPEVEDEGGAGFFELPPAEPPRSGPDGMPWKGKDSTGWRSAPPLARRTPEGATVVQRIEFDVAASTEGGWRLKPHVKPASQQDREAFCAAVEVLLQWPRGSFRDKVKIQKERRGLVTKHRTAISRAYAWAFGDKNETSLSLYSGPADPQTAGAVMRNSRTFARARVGWMGTGDAGFRNPQAVQGFQHYYRDEMDWVSTFMLPHHGSAHNFDPALFVVDADLWVAAAQPIHLHWKHPAPEIVKAIKASGALFRRVGSSPKSLLEERMVVFWPG
ncbi:hypothetical protein [Mesorhizobium sp. L103C105A0]|uniref:hypothetical protein n=1 Tax=Mesorhizobium sp. L103C105A0 TaxID=1287074 RepID=UPI0003CFE65A|nr:hypothetical protein [Mesorhizobium sp. L103C105A0]ESZ78662.1 hypothetical protein X726_04085 [Mesorhizobium sp. L103C105A0]